MSEMRAVRLEMRGAHELRAVGGHSNQSFVQQFRHRRVEPFPRLVEQQHARMIREHAAEQCAARLAVRQRAQQPVGERGERRARRAVARRARFRPPSAGALAPTLDVKPDAMHARTVDG